MRASTRAILRSESAVMRSLVRRPTPTGTTLQPFWVGVSTRTSSLKIQREHGEPKRNCPTSALGVIASSSGIELSEKRFSRTSTSEPTRLSTNEDSMRSRNSVIVRLPHCSPIQASEAPKSFAIRTTSDAAGPLARCRSRRRDDRCARQRPS